MAATWKRVYISDEMLVSCAAKGAVGRVETDDVEAADKADVLFTLHEPSPCMNWRVEYPIKNGDSKGR